ncbi:TPA: sel1 repeat family protein [Legionella pneumophila]|nr:sel1 repeat family protein [Legionella pneumophila]
MKIFIFLLMILSSLVVNSSTKNNSSTLSTSKICEDGSDQKLLQKNPGHYFFRRALLCNYEHINNQETFDKTIAILSKSAQYKYPPAYLLMGILYENKYESGSLIYNARGVPQDLTKAIINLEIASSMGSTIAQNKLAELYLDDAHLIEKNTKTKDISNADSLIPLPNITKAIYWFKLAAKNGNPAAQGSLSELYKMGIGIPQNYVKAYIWQNLCIVSQYRYNKTITSESMGKVLLNSHIETRDKIYKELSAKQKIEAQKLSEIYAKKFVKKPGELDLFSTNSISYISAINIKKILG